MRMRRHMGATGAVVCIALLCNAMPVLASAVPFVETFEDTPAGMASNTAEVLHGQHDWEVSPTNTAIVQTSVRYAGAKAGSMVNSIVSHAFETANATNVWVDFYARVPARGDASPPTLSSGSSLGFYIDHNANAVATDVDVWVTNTVYVFSNDSWVRLTANVDYIATTWSLYVAGSTVNETATNLFTDLDFRSGTVSNYLSKFKVTGESEETRIYMDNISMGRDDAEGKPAHIDSDYDRMSDKWEIDRFGDLTKDGSVDTDVDGHSDLAEFTAGTDPTNVLSYLRIVDVDLSSSNSAHITVTWEGGGYSVTSIYAGDSVARTYSLMASDNSYSATTSLVATVDEGAVTETTNTWEDISAADLYASRFYNVVLANYAGLVATNVEDWGMFKQERMPSERYLVCVPVDYTGTNNNLLGKLGTQLGRGLFSDTTPDGDRIELRDPATGDTTNYYWDGGSWYEAGGGSPVDVELTPGQAFWVVRSSDPAPDRTNAVFAGRIWTDSTVSNITVYTKQDATNGWNLMGWALANDKVVSGSNTSSNQLGFSAAGGKGALTGDWRTPNEIGDMIYVWNKGAFRQMWLIGGAGVPWDGRWWDERAFSWTEWTFQPGDAFFYYSDSGGNMTNFVWTPEP